MVDEPVIGHNDPFVNEQNIPATIDAGVTLRRSQKTKRLFIPDDYEIYL